MSVYDEDDEHVAEARGVYKTGITMNRCRSLLVVGLLAAVTAVGAMVYRRNRPESDIEPPF